MKERTLIFIKPDGVRRKLVGEILSHYEKADLTILDLKLHLATEEQLLLHYEEHIGKPFFEALIKYVLEGPIVLCILEGENAIELCRKINGDKDFLKADRGSIRGKYASSSTYNLVHASDSQKNAEREIGIWF